MEQKIEIQRTPSSRIKDIDFDNLVFGQVFSDHMFTCEYLDGRWHSPKIEPYGPLKIEPSMRVLHYGQAVFEGMKAYKDDKGKVRLFRPRDNAERINISAKRLDMPEFPVGLFIEGLKLLAKIDEQWILQGDDRSLYIRPLMFASDPSIMASSSNEYKFIIFSCPVQSYYSGEVSVKIADYYSRAASGGVGFSKAAGNYAAQFYPTRLAIEEGFQQIIWTDSNEHKYLEEAGTMNIFFRVNNKLITAPTVDRILDGITRRCVMVLSQENNIELEERFMEIEELIAASEDGSLKEIFGVGTAVVVTPVTEFGYKGKRWSLPKMEDSYAKSFKKQITDIQYSRSEDRFGWLEYV